MENRVLPNFDLQFDEQPDWRRLEVGETDLSAEARVPLRSLRPIPEAARTSFAPSVTRLPGLRAGENDLTRIAPGRPQAEGVKLLVSGSITDENGRPLRGVLLEVWNANKWGRYTHKDDPAVQQLDPNFLGYGRVLTDDDGRYSFATIRPGSYLVRPEIDRWRPSHIHLSVRGGSSRLMTQMYFPNDPLLDIDPGFQLFGAAGARQIGAESVSRTEGIDTDIRFDIVIGGRNPTIFED
ncbi:hypothetical protein [Sphingobium subterraneum]|uniref:Protocatechuate 3,4-dioxygenase beta subunit n=1 Tax=Sphingobium subterraneum TaxID=627688 RepID=A0A841IZ77_9SPHN|nr:hypothetical protein [Sphingobium subterraneum]MBB6123432.1 protocatechuate 3,4-dioxygenase beta subunit [Sphingobium subterraneum]